MKLTIARGTIAMVVCLIGDLLRAQNAVPPVAPRPAADGIDTMPILRLEAGGPTSFVSALAFNPQSGTLYTGGWDKVVRAWEPAAQGFMLDAAATYRVPIGPGRNGFVNAVAVSPDGLWLAVGGKGLARGSSDWRHPGLIVSAASMSREACLDEGTIHLFNTRTRQLRTLIGHMGPVVALAFAPAHAGKSPLLVSIGQERKPGESEANAAVVRAWDVGRAADLGGRMLPDIEKLGRPGIAVWHTGTALQQISVAIACGDGQLRFWDVGSKDPRQAVRLAPDGPAKGSYNNTAEWWAEKKRLVTGSVGNLKLWNVAAAPTAEAVQLPNKLDVPQAIALFASSNKGPVDRAAVAVTFRKDARDMVRLLIVDLNASRILPNSEIPLWDGTGITPSVAASSGGRLLAMAGNDNHQILTLAIDDLIPGRRDPVVLQGKGAEARSVSFVKKGGNVGVLVSQRAKPAPGAAPGAPAADDLVFDPKLRSVSKDLTGWEVARPAPVNWRVDVTGIAEKKPFITVIEDNRPVRQFAVPGLTDCALLPPQAAGGVPILAVASHSRRQPLLQLFNAASGAPVRELSGHDYLIESLAFSDDGKLLVSAAGDRTICIWGLADLDSVVGSRGALGDVELQEDGRSLVVVKIKPNGPNSAGQVAPGDALIGWVTDNGIQPVGSLLGFFRQVARSKPNDVISLRRQRKGRPADTVQLILGQGIDERKPLVTLFVTHDEARNWIGWSPLGPYESSGAEVEKLLGWHFNTGLPTTPTRFALADEYQNMRREGLVEHLLREQALPADNPPPLGRPPMSIRLNQSEPGYEVQIADGHSPLKLVGSEAEINFEIRGLNADQVGQVTWRLGDGEPHRMEAISPQVWAAKLSALPIKPCDSSPVRLAVTTNEAQPQTFTEEVSLTYQPLAPVFEEVTPKEVLTIVQAEVFSLEAHVRPRTNPIVDFEIRVTHNGEPVLKQTHAEKCTIRQDLNLKPGDNTIRMVATNVDANACEEEVIVVRQITYNPEAVKPPELTLKAFVPGGDRQVLTSHEAGMLVVYMPTLSLEGGITADKPLTRTDWKLGLADERPFAGFAKNAQAKIDVNETISLQPGRQTLRCVAQAEGSVATEVSLMIEYRPRLPELLIDPPQNTDLVEGRDSSRIKLAGRLVSPPDKHPFKAVVLLNGREQSDSPVIDATGQAFSVELALNNGENRIEVQLSNEWGAKTASEAVSVNFLRPPKIVEVRAPLEVIVAVVDLNFVVESPTELELTGLRINDQELPLAAAVADPPVTGTTRWTVTAHDIPLRVGPNPIRPLARNRDGWSVITQAVEVNMMVPPPPRPEIEFKTPVADRTWGSSQLDVEFAVRSQSRLRHVELRNGPHAPSIVNVNQQIAEPQAAGKPPTWLLTATERVDLDPRDNRLEVVAVNDGGESESHITVTYVRKPVDVVIDRLQSQSQPDKILEAKSREGGRVVFAEGALDGNQWLHGRVRWPDAASRRPDAVYLVQVFVNGFLQPPVALKPPNPERAKDLEWAWKTKVRLNHEQQNEISVHLTGAAHEAASRLDCKVNCDKPDKRQRLHLFIVGVGDDNPEALRKMALEAVQGRPTQGDQIETPAFAKGWIYPLSGYVTYPKVAAQLDKIKRHIGDRMSVDAGTDVVMVYFRSHEMTDDQGQLYLFTSRSYQVPGTLSSHINEKDFLNRFSNIPGAEVFLLDVQRQDVIGAAPPSPESGSRWPRDPQVAVLRYVWTHGGALAVGAPSTPKDARLLEAVSSAVPRATRLGDVEDEVAASSLRARGKYPDNFTSELLVPAVLRKLVLAGP